MSCEAACYRLRVRVAGLMEISLLQAGFTILCRLDRSYGKVLKPF